jgi:4-alpha-glucanotransferase
MPAPPLVRASGLLLHPTSLPGPFGVGDLGPEAYRWLDTLAHARQRWWQILPLGPTGGAGSPYQSYSAFAGNINLLSPELLARDGLLPADFFAGRHFNAHRVEFETVGKAKEEMVRAAWDRFGAGHKLRSEFEAYCVKEAAWLTDYARFMAIRAALGGQPLADWPDDLRTRQPVAVAEMDKALRKEILILQFGQFLFDRQWHALREYAKAKNIRIFGDAPIFVAGDSADVWANPDQFLLNADGKPDVVAGVPPDYFNEDGQLWGNPLYDWDRMAATGYAWWTARLARNLAQVDLVRLDHFRGFAAAWHVPAADTNTKRGKWVPGAGADLFRVMEQKLGPLPVVAEDLGVITDDVTALRVGCGFPGMKVLQFMLGGPDNPYWPHNHSPDMVAYTGTHDNDTVVGWWHGLSDHDRGRVGEYVGHWIDAPHWELIRLAWASVAVLAFAPLQDVLGLGTEGRMNMPGEADGHWAWRFRADQFPGGGLEKLAAFTERYGRLGKGA